MRFLLLLLAVLTWLPSLHAEDQNQIEFEFKFIKAEAGLELPTDLAALNRLKGVDLISAPRVWTKPDQRVQVEITEPLKPPIGGFVTPDDKPVTGATFEGIAHFEGNGISFRIHFTRCDISGVAAANTQIQTESHDLYASGTAEDGEVMRLRLAGQPGSQQLYLLLTLKRHKA